MSPVDFTEPDYSPPATVKKSAKKWRIAVDDRTKDMPNEVIVCRANGHPWTEVPVPANRLAALEAIGLTELRDICLRCQLPRTQTYELGSGNLLTSDIDYKRNPDYLIKQKGTGKLPRSDAKRALLVRRLPQYAA